MELVLHEIMFRLMHQGLRLGASAIAQVLAVVLFGMVSLASSSLPGTLGSFAA